MRLCSFGLSRSGLLLLASVCWAAADLRLIEAIQRRDYQALDSLIAKQADLSAAQPDGATALAWAAFLDDTTAALALVAAGARVDTADAYGETPLTLACANGNATLVEKLLKAGADAHAARWDGETALMIAAGAGNPDVVKQLIARGADVNAAESRKGQTALMWAAAEGHPEITRLLIEHGAKIGMASKAGFTPLAFAAMHDDVESVRALIAAGANANSALPDGTKVLWVATAWHSVKTAVALVDSGADPNIADRTGRTPLHAAAEFGSIEFTRRLLTRRVDVNARTARAPVVRSGYSAYRPPSGEQTALLIAAENNHPEILRALIGAGADPLLKAQDSVTLLMTAASSGHLEAVKAAYEFDRRVNAVTDAGATVMHAAVAAATGASTEPPVLEVVEFLAGKGAPLDVKDGRGHTPRSIAERQGLDNIVELLSRLILKSGSSPAVPRR